MCLPSHFTQGRSFIASAWHGAAGKSAARSTLAPRRDNRNRGIPTPEIVSAGQGLTRIRRTAALWLVAWELRVQSKEDFTRGEKPGSPYLESSPQLIFPNDHRELRATPDGWRVTFIRSSRSFTCSARMLMNWELTNSPAPSAVSSAALQLEVDLVVIGRGASSGMLGRLRTNAYSITRQAPCPAVSI